MVSVPPYVYCSMFAGCARSICRVILTAAPVAAHVIREVAMLCNPVADRASKHVIVDRVIRYFSVMSATDSA